MGDHERARKKPPSPDDPRYFRTCTRCYHVRRWVEGLCPECGNGEFSLLTAIGPQGQVVDADFPEKGHLSYRDPAIVVDAEQLRHVERLRSWFRLLGDAEIVERMQAEGMTIVRR